MTTTKEAKGLYSVREISRMTDSALDELLAYYEDTGNEVGIERVEDEQQAREDDRPEHYDSPSLEDAGLSLGNYAS